MLDYKVKQGILAAATEAIPKTKDNRRKVMPRWDEMCKEAVRDRNRAFRQVKITHNFQHLI